MKERPIIFSAPMVRAILEGKKTQTRRGVKPVLPMHIERLRPWFREKPGVWIDADGTNEERRCPYGVVGDRLWVRETWCLASDDYGDDNWPPPDGRPSGTYDEKCWYRATEPDVEGAEGKSPWRPSIFMPRWASRITLEIADVRVERLQDISEEDARSEGIREVTKDGEVRKFCVYDRGDYSATPWADMPRSARAAFSALWDSINGDGAWASNPWVWALTFKRDGAA